MSEWTPETLKQYVDSQSIAHERAITAALASIDRRLDSMNEFRDQLKDQTVGFITRVEYNARHSDIENQLNTLKGTRREGSTSTLQAAMMVLLALTSVTSIIIAIIALH